MDKIRKSRLYKVWIDMKNRCNNPNNHNYTRYGKKGIKVCKEWEEDYKKFYNWAIENGYKENQQKKYTIDRIDNSKGYNPKNCRLLSIQKQQSNRTNNHFITYKGETHTVSEWARKLGISTQTIFTRIRIGLPTDYLFSKERLTTKKIKEIKKELVDKLESEN